MHIESERMKIRVEAFQLSRNKEKMGAIVVREVRREEETPDRYAFSSFGDDDTAFITHDLTFRCDRVTDEQVNIAFDEIER